MPSADALGDISTINPPGADPTADANSALDPPTADPQIDSQSVKPMIPGTHIGEGLPPVPAKLAAKILRHEFVEMHELLPELWSKAKDDNKPAARTIAKKRVLDITVWLQCFALYVGVLAPKFPLEVPELMAYMIAIIRATQEFEGPAWAAYDAAFRCQAAAQGLRQWSKINPSLYAICFTGKVRRQISVTGA